MDKKKASTAYAKMARAAVPKLFWAFPNLSWWTRFKQRPNP